MLGRKTGGRPKGVPNKATAAKARAIARSGVTPLDYMLRVMRNSKTPPLLRLEAAKSAAPYIHPKLSSIIHSGSEEPIRAEIIVRGGLPAPAGMMPGGAAGQTAPEAAKEGPEDK